MKLKTMIKIIWLCACIAVLWFVYEERAIHDAEIVFAYAILTLTFPIGVLAQGILFYLGEIFDLSLPNTFTTDAIIWGLFVILGYFQWFVALPWTIKRLKIWITSRKKIENIS